MIAQSAVAGLQTRHADLVVLNANIRTMTSKNAKADAIAVDGGRITSVGSDRSIRKLIGPATRVIDAGGRLVTPGFNDSHVHFMGIGNGFSSMDLRDVKTPEEITKRIEHYVSFLPKGRWILGGGWTTVVPDRSAVNKSAPDNPVFLYQAGGRSGFANDAAIKIARVGTSTGIETDAKGEPTGVISGAALDRIARAAPSDHTRNWIEIAETATNYAASLGVTSVQDMHSDDRRSVYRDLHRQGKLKSRVYDCLSLPDWRTLDEMPTATGDQMVHGGCLKSFADGDDTSAARIRRDALPADKAGFQIMVHAIGNTANATVLDVFEEIVRMNGPRDRRLRVEHAQNPRQEDIARYVRSGILVSMQPHLFEVGNGGHYSTFLKMKTALAFGSDAAITDFNPLLGIAAAVDAGSEAISVYDAVRAYTVGSAYAEFREKEKGTIEVGKLADFVILSDDIFVIRPDRIRETKILVTVVAGKVVFEKPLVRGG